MWDIKGLHVHTRTGSSGVSVTTNSTVNLVVNESNGEQTTPNVSTAVDSENKSEWK